MLVVISRSMNNSALRICLSVVGPLLLGPAAAMAQAKTPPKTPPSSTSPAPAAPKGTTQSPLGAGQLSVGGELGIGIPFQGGVGLGLKAAGQGFYWLPDLSPGVSLGVGGQLALSIHPFADFTVWFIDLVPTGRVRLTQVIPNMVVYGEGGLGLGFIHTSFSAFGISGSDTSLSFLLKLGGGVEFKLDEKMTVTAGAALNFYTASGSFQELTLMGGLLYKI